MLLSHYTGRISVTCCAHVSSLQRHAHNLVHTRMRVSTQPSVFSKPLHTYTHNARKHALSLSVLAGLSLSVLYTYPIALPETERFVFRNMHRIYICIYLNCASFGFSTYTHANRCLMFMNNGLFYAISKCLELWQVQLTTFKNMSN